MNMTTARSLHSKPWVVGMGVVVLAISSVGCSGSGQVSQSQPSIVVTYSILGSVVSEVVGDAANVRVLIPNGIDPHSWEPSAKDLEALDDADLIVSNGLDLEGNLLDIIDNAEKSGVAVFHATDHIEVIEFTMADEHEEGDPHFWTSPVAMAAVAVALGDTLSKIGVDVSDRAALTAQRLLNLDREIGEIIAEIDSEARILVTGHESLGYFAHEFGFKVVGTIIPGLSSEAEAAAGDLANLKSVIEAEGVDVIFTELGTSSAVVESLAQDAGVSVVELSTHFLPAGASYETFMSELASTIASAFLP